MPLLFFFGVWFVLELFVLIAIGKAIGFFGVILLLFAGTAAGSYLVRMQRTKFAVQMQSMQLQPQAMQEGMMRLLAGILLMMPGFISDIFGIVLLVPGLRRLFGGSLLRAFKPEVVMGRFGCGQDVPRNSYEHDGTVEAKTGSGQVIEAEFIDHDSGARR